MTERAIDKELHELRTRVFEAFGELSMCWQPIPSGVFDSTRAKEIGDKLVDYISRQVQADEQAQKPTAPASLMEALVKRYREDLTVSRLTGQEVYKDWRDWLGYTISVYQAEKPTADKGLVEAPKILKGKWYWGLWK